MGKKTVSVVLVLMIGCMVAAYSIQKAHRWTGRETGVIEINLAIKEKLNPSNKEGMFHVPKSFVPQVHGDMFSVMFKFPSGEPVFPTAVLGDVIDVRVCYSEDGKMRADYALSRMQKPGESFKNSLSLVGKENDMDVYEYDFGSKKVTIGKKYIFKDEYGNQVVVDGSGIESGAYRVFRRLNDHVELDYSFNKVLKPENFREVDRIVLQVIRSFQD